MSIELKILDFIQTLHTPVLDKIMVGITRLGVPELSGSF